MTVFERTLALLALVTALAWSGLAHAVMPDEVLDDPALEARARALSVELRCMVCQNQSIDDSDAPLARDLRILVRERLVEGDTDEQVLAFLVDRYGDFILLRPPFNWATVILWSVPALALLGGAGFAIVNFRRRASATAPAALSDSERAELDRILSEKD